jgi:phosphotransferase system HPr-like phosphotransfer protein
LTVGTYVVDAKSIMGIFTLDREHPIRLEVKTVDEGQLSALRRAIGKYLYEPVH